jgi:hypothetical protein
LPSGSTSELPNFLGGQAYINVHTVQFAGGEMRGIFGAVPKPSTWAMMLFGFGMIGFALRPRKCAEYAA